MKDVVSFLRSKSSVLAVAATVMAAAAVGAYVGTIPTAHAQDAAAKGKGGGKGGAKGAQADQGPPPHAEPKPGADLTGMWQADVYNMSINSFVVGGGAPPLNAAGKAKMAELQAGLKDASWIDRSRKYCTPDGIPRSLMTPYPFQIIYAPPGQMTWVYEQNRMIRGISMVKDLDTDEKLSLVPFWNGHSAGYWEGDTLVIKTAGFNEFTLMDGNGLPHSDALHTEERVRLINGGKQLEDVVTIHDPTFYSADWKARFVYNSKPGLRMMDYICGETHRDISGIKGVKEARAANAQRAPFQ